jgi:hypothetical protein
MPFLFSCCSAFLQSSFLSLLYYIKYHDTVQWGVQSIAALGLLEKHKFYHIHSVCIDRKFRYCRAYFFTAAKIVQQKIHTHEKKQNRLSIPAWEKPEEALRLTANGNIFSA